MPPPARVVGRFQTRVANQPKPPSRRPWNAQPPARQLLTQFSIKNGAGAFSLVVVPSGSTTVMFETNRLASGQVSELNVHSLQCGQHRVSGFTGHNGEVGTPEACWAREMFTPLPPGSCTAPTALHGTVGQGRAEFNGAVQAGDWQSE